MTEFAVETRALLLAHGTLVTWVKDTREIVRDVPVLITDQPGGGVDHGRASRTAQIRVSKQDVPSISYQDKFVEDDGTEWTVTDTNRVINDRTVGTWRVMVTAQERKQK